MKTKKTRQSVKAFLDGIEDDKRRADSRALTKLLEDVSKEKPALWGHGLIGFGTYHYKYPSGREGDWYLTGLSPRKQALTIYVMPGFEGYDELMAELGEYKSGKSCIYVKQLEDIHLPTLKKLVRKSIAHTKKLYR